MTKSFSAEATDLLRLTKKAAKTGQLSFDNTAQNGVLTIIDDAHRRAHAQLTRHEWITWEQKQEAFRRMKYKLAPKFEEIARDQHPIRLVRTGRRSGKSTYAAAEAVATMMMKPDSLGWIIAPTYDLVSRCWDMIIKSIDRLVAMGFVKYRTRVNTKNQMKIVLDNGASAEGHTAGGEALQGVGLHWLIMDEVAQIPPWIFLEIVVPAVIQQGGWTLLIGTPRGEMWATREARLSKVREERRGEPSLWTEFTFGSWHNVFEFPGGRTDPSILQMERTMSYAAFQEQICAQPQSSSSIIYKEFNEQVHARNCPFDSDLPVYLSIDPSTGANPYGVLAIQDYGSMIKVIDEYYQIGKITDEVINELRTRVWWENCVEGIVDDAVPQERKAWQRHDDVHFSVKMAKKSSRIEDSIPLVREWLRDPMKFNAHTAPIRDRIVGTLFPDYTWADLMDDEKNSVMAHVEDEVAGKPEILLECARIFIDRFRCKNMIEEFRSYTYRVPRNANLNVSEDPVDFKDHLMSCTRYWLFRHKRTYGAPRAEPSSYADIA